MHKYVSTACMSVCTSMYMLYADLILRGPLRKTMLLSCCSSLTVLLGFQLQHHSLRVAFPGQCLGHPLLCCLFSLPCNLLHSLNITSFLQNGPAPHTALEPKPCLAHSRP